MLCFLNSATPGWGVAFSSRYSLRLHQERSTLRAFDSRMGQRGGFFYGLLLLDYCCSQKLRGLGLAGVQLDISSSGHLSGLLLWSFCAALRETIGSVAGLLSLSCSFFLGVRRICPHSSAHGLPLVLAWLFTDRSSPLGTNRNAYRGLWTLFSVGPRECALCQYPYFALLGNQSCF